MNEHLPEKFTERLKQIFPPEQYSQLLNTFKNEKATCFRINTLKTSEQDVLNALTQLGIAPKKIDLLQNTYSISQKEKSQLTHSDIFNDGLVYIQNLSSMIPVAVLNPHMDDKVLDIAAAPGSKTTQIAIAMQNEGWISAVEINKSRFFKLKDNLATQGINNVHTYLMDGGDVWKKCPEMFDKILVDAPCSSESRFSLDNPTSFAYWSEKKIREMVIKQKRLIFSAFLSLKPKGTLVYATCSFAPEENEMIVNYLLKKFESNAEVEPVQLDINNSQSGFTQWNGKHLNDSIHNAIRILPNNIMDGFFICKIRKINSTIRSQMLANRRRQSTPHAPHNKIQQDS